MFCVTIYIEPSSELRAIPDRERAFYGVWDRRLDILAGFPLTCRHACETWNVTTRNITLYPCISMPLFV